MYEVDNIRTHGFEIMWSLASVQRMSHEMDSVRFHKNFVLDASCTHKVVQILLVVTDCVVPFVDQIEFAKFAQTIKVPI